MGLILCEGCRAEHPLYIEELNLHVFTLEELCYVIVNNPLLVADNFVTDQLTSFVGQQLHLSFANIRMNQEEYILSILGSCDYYSPSEIESFKEEWNHLRMLSEHEFRRKKADFFFRSGKYGKAITAYEDAMDAADTKGTPHFYATVYRNIGSCYANLFSYHQAFTAYRQAYNFERNRSILKYIYYLSLVEPVIENRQEYLEAVGNQIDPHWDRDYENAVEAANASVAVEKLHEELHTDSVKRNRILQNTINQWKQEYRNMI